MDQNNLVRSLEKEERLKLLSSYSKQTEISSATKQASDREQQKMAELSNINVTIPKDEKSPGKVTSLTSKQPEGARQPKLSHITVGTKAPISFKLDLSKCRQD